MKLFLIGLAIIATAHAITNDYLPPNEEYSSAASAVDSNVLEYEPAHSLADDGYRYKAVKRYRLRHRRDVNELTSSYLPPHAASAPAPVYSAQEPAYSAQAETAPAPVYSAPAQSFDASYETAASDPAHTLANDGYRYKTVKRYRLRHRRDVNELTSSYLPPHAASAPAPVYSAPEPAYSAQAETAPAPVYSAPAQSFDASYETAASEPAHTLANDGYRYKTVKRYRLRHRRDVNELTSSYLPPHAASAPAPVYSAPEPAYSAQAETAPAPVYSAPAQSFDASYETAASEPAHTLANDGYRYKTVKRYRLRHRRDVNELTSSYLPPHAASAPAPVYSAPEPAYSAQAETAPAPVYSAPAQSFDASYETAASEPAHTLANDGYRYKTVKRYRLRHRRDVNELTSSYLPPHAASAPAPVYSAPDPAYSVQAETAPAPVYSAPAQSFDASYETAASEPAHTLANDGYRYKTVKRYRLRHRRDVNELTSSYLPPHAASAPAPVYSAPEPAYSVQAETAPAPVYAAPAPQSYDATSTFESAASEYAPAHSLSDDGYRYKTVKRFRYRHRN